jgi:VWFA-related protein
MLTKARAALTLWVLGLSVVAMSAQTSLPVLVVDRSGQAVHGLQRSDFDVRCAKSASFDSVEEILPLKFSSFSDPVPIFILLDGISIPKARQSEVEQWLLSYLRKAADEHLALTVLATTTTGIRVIHDMSADSRVFTAAMDRVAPKAGQAPGATSGLPEAFAKAVDEEIAQLQILTQPMAIIPADDYVRLMSLQLESLRMVGKMLQHSPKRKALVWVSGSFPAHLAGGQLVVSYTVVNVLNSLPEFRTEGLANLDPAFEAAIDSLNDARVSLYPLAVESAIYYSKPNNLETTSVLTGIGAAIAAQSSNGMQYRSGAGFRDLATGTGGSVLTVPDKTGLASAISDLQRHFDSYYLLRFTVQTPRKTTWVESSVKVDKPDTKTTAANGFFAVHE